MPDQVQTPAPKHAVQAALDHVRQTYARARDPIAAGRILNLLAAMTKRVQESIQ